MNSRVRNFIGNHSKRLQFFKLGLIEVATELDDGNKSAGIRDVGKRIVRKYDEIGGLAGVDRAESRSLTRSD